MKKFVYNTYLFFWKKKGLNGDEVLNFSNLLSRVKDILIIFPREPEEHSKCTEFALQLAEAGKNITVLMSSVVNLNELLYHNVRKSDYHDSEFGFLGLPKGSLKNRLKDASYDLIIDLDFRDYSSVSVLTAFPKSRYRLGFSKRHDEKFYNFIHATAAHEDGNYKKLLELIINI